MFWFTDDTEEKDVTGGEEEMEEEEEKESSKHSASIDSDGIHIEDGGDRVDVDSKGIHYTSKDGKKHDIVSADGHSVSIDLGGNKFFEDDDDDEDDDDEDDDDEDDDDEDGDSIRIAGSGRISSGEHGTISIAGGGRFEGPLHCKRLTVSGSLKGTGDISAEKDIRVSGSFRSDGKLVSKGSINVAGALSASSVKADRLRFSGSVSLNGDAEADGLAEICGKAEIGGLLNAEKIEIHTGRDEGMVRIGSMGGTDIVVREDRERVSSFSFGKFFLSINSRKDALPAEKNVLITSSIEGDTIDLEGVKADVVRGKDVTLRAGCTVARVEYSNSIKIENGAEVGEKAKI